MAAKWKIESLKGMIKKKESAKKSKNILLGHTF